MNRIFGRWQRQWFCLMLLLSAAAAASGCTMVATGLWVINPNDASAQFKGLKDQRVVVVCRPTNALEYRDSSVASQLNRDVSRNLKENVSKIKMVPSQEVDNWLDNNELSSYIEIGKALGADKVVAIDLEHFRLFHGTTLLQGQASLNVFVYDVESGDIEFERDPLEALYPPNNPIPRDSGNTEAIFRRKFVGVLGDQIARTFYAYDSRVAHRRDVFYE